MFLPGIGYALYNLDLSEFQPNLYLQNIRLVLSSLGFYIHIEIPTGWILAYRILRVTPLGIPTGFILPDFAMC